MQVPLCGNLHALTAQRLRGPEQRRVDTLRHGDVRVCFTDVFSGADSRAKVRRGTLADGLGQIHHLNPLMLGQRCRWPGPVQHHDDLSGVRGVLEHIRDGLRKPFFLARGDQD
jgi:hypothetical protein